MAELKLPEWAEVVSEPDQPMKIAADPEKFYPAFMKEFGIKALDQYWGEVIYQCMKMDLQEASKCWGKEPLSIKVLNRPKYALKGMPDPDGNGIVRATKGKEARALYLTIREHLPVDLKGV